MLCEFMPTHAGNSHMSEFEKVAMRKLAVETPPEIGKLTPFSSAYLLL